MPESNNFDCRDARFRESHSRIIKIAQCFRSVTAVVALAAMLACGRREDAQHAFVKSLRCGMNRDEVSRAAHEHGYNPSDASWLQRSVPAKKSKELTLVDLTFRDGRLVAVREGTYDPRTKQTTWRTTELCVK